MKNFTKYIFLSLVIVFLSCKEEAEKPKVIYEDASKDRSEVKTVAEKILVADLPVQMEGTSVLLYPIGEFSVSDGSSKTKYSSSERASFTVSNASENEITGYLSNFKFQQIGSDSLKVLTDKPVLIERVTYLKSIADKTKKQFLVYVLEDMDSNKDGKHDENDIKNLYISNIDGTNFKKLSVDLQEFIDWNVIEAQNRLYFRTIEDINKNGAFDKADKVHYQFVDLLDKELKVVEYNPI
ncbi:hypothetical protein [Flavobacterium sp.]|uniref:hypothetical protein n=1 Tax=Flavobacterium sp. TaxID=239 RepID=UPI00260E9570|nr:hypothetical protein [Flavobacterium sp.]